MMAVEQRAVENPMEAFYREVEGKDMAPLWRYTLNDPSAAGAFAPYRPWRWRWPDIRGFLLRAGELARPGPEAERRVLQLANPGVRPIRAATHTLIASVQMVLPEALNLYREDAYPDNGSHQHVVASYDERYS
jgi:gentisate 1,2-dioxygenase